MENQYPILCFGPFLGDFESEIMNFKPFVRWVREHINHSACYVSVYENRRFLYPDCNTEFCILREDLQDLESNQFNFINITVLKKEYESITKEFKSNIIKKEKTQKKNLRHFSFPYSQSSQNHSIYEKIFERMKFEEGSKNNDVLLIPSITEDISVYYNIIDMLNENGIEFSIIGNKNIHFRDKNIIDMDGETNYDVLLNRMNSANTIICPASFWTSISNLMSKNVFSWGKYIGNYRNDGIYHFDNANCSTLAFDSKSQNTKILLKQLKSFLIKSGDLK